MKELSFIMPTHGKTFQQVFLEEERFRMAAFAVKERSRIAQSETRPRLEAAGIHFGDNRPRAEITKAIGASGVSRLHDLTTSVVDFVDADVKSTLDAFIKLRATLQSIYPNRQFIDLETVKRPDAQDPKRLSAPGGGGEIRRYDFVQMQDAMIECGRALERRLIAGERYPFANMINAMREIHRGSHRPYPCGAGAGYLAVSADGELAACRRFVGDAEGAMGTLASVDRGRQAR